MSTPEILRIRFGNTEVGPGRPCYIIAEIGVNFDGDLDCAKATIDAAVACGANAVKFQTFNADEFIADKNLMYSYTLANGTTVTESQYDMFKRLELPAAWHKILHSYCAERKIDFFSSVADRSAVDLLNSINVIAFKLASEDLINVDLLEYVAAKKRPTIISTGMGDLDEIQNAVQIFKKADHSQFVVLHCVSAYPAPLNSCNMQKIQALSNLLRVPIGFSDHTEGTEAAVVAVSCGACVIEKHFTIDRNRKGPDHQMSSDPSELAELVKRVRTTETILGDGALTFASIEEKGRLEFRRSIVASRDIAQGEIITAALIAFRRPGGGLKPYQKNLVLGKPARRSLRLNQNILLSDVE